MTAPSALPIRPDGAHAPRQLRGRVLDLAVLFVLASVPALQWVPVYGSFAPVRAMVAGALLVGVVLLGAGVLRLSASVAATLAVVVVLILGPVASGLGGLSPSGVQQLLRGCVTGWRDMLTVATPIGGSGTLLAPPLLIGAVTIGAAGLIADTRRYPLALLPVALAFVGVALLGQAVGVDGGVAVLAGVSLVLGLGWLSRRRMSGVQVLGSRAARWRRPSMAAALLVGAALAAAAVGGSAGGAVGHRQDRLALRTSLAVPVDPRALPSPLSGFRAAVKDDAATVQFEVSGVTPGDRLRLASLDAYDGQIFTATADEGPFARIGAQVDRSSAGDPGAPVRPGVVRRVHVEVAGSSSPYAPVLGDLTSVTFSGARAGELTDGFRYSVPASTGVLPAGWRAGDGFTESVVVPVPPTSPELAAAQISTMSDFVTPPVPDALRVAAARYAGGLANPGAQLTAIANGLAADGYFSDGRADQLRSPSGHGLDRLLGMVSGSAMVGDQEQYAVLMAVLARSLGIPARVAVGYQIPAGASGTVAITGRDLTAWVEAPFQGWGWVAFDPTPQRTKTTIDKAPQAQAGRHVADNVPPPAIAGTDSASVQPGTAQQQKDVQPAAPVSAPVRAATIGWRVWVLLGLAAMAVLGALPICVVIVWKALRRRRRRIASSPAARARTAWRELVDVAVDAGFRPARGQTRAEIAQELAGSLSVDAGSTAALASVADAAEFSPVPVPEHLAQAQWEAVADRTAELLRGLHRRSRLRARLSIASLRPGLR